MGITVGVTDGDGVDVRVTVAAGVVGNGVELAVTDGVTVAHAQQPDGGPELFGTQASSAPHWGLAIQAPHAEA